ENDLATPTLIDTVEILYSAVGGVPTDVLVTGGAVITHEICTTVTAPTALSFNSAIVRVRDADAGFNDKVYADSAAFNVLGRVSYGASPAQDADWFIGDTGRQVIWSAVGDEMTQLAVYVDYGAGFSYLTTVASGSSPWIFEDPIASGAVGNNVTETAQIRLQDTDADRGPLTQYDSPTFHITGKFENVNIVAAVDVSENTEVVSEITSTITWTKTGTAITDVILEYTINDGGQWNLVDGLSTVSNTETYSWTPPETLISSLCRIRITDPDNSAAQGESASNFIIASKAKVALPDTNASWDTNTTETITWQKWGDFATVNIYYRPDDQTAWDLLNTSGPVESCQDEIDGLGDKRNGSWD
ncbi:MAG: hypothetical protein KAI72_02085, partial [Candidatus Pacebacteria bacterium]|nr:hypothetical protein [Candidatus Paceibacterota bacterium]